MKTLEKFPWPILVFGIVLIISAAIFKQSWLGDDTVFIGVNLILVSAMWLVHLSGSRNTTKAFGNQDREATFRLLKESLELCARAYCKNWMAAAKLFNDKFNSTRKLLDTSVDNKVWDKIKDDLKENEDRGPLGDIIKNPFGAHARTGCTVVETFAYGIRTISKLENGDVVEVMRKAFWLTARQNISERYGEQEMIINEGIYQFLTDFVLLSSEIEELRDRVTPSLIDDMKIIIKEWDELEPFKETL